MRENARLHCGQITGMVSRWSIVGTCTDDKAMRSGTWEEAADF